MQGVGEWWNTCRMSSSEHLHIGNTDVPFVLIISNDSFPSGEPVPCLCRMTYIPREHGVTHFLVQYTSLCKVLKHIPVEVFLLTKHPEQPAQLCCTQQVLLRNSEGSNQRVIASPI